MGKKKFKLFNTDWEIEYVDSFDGEDDSTIKLGNTNHLTHKIQVARIADGVKLSKEDIELTLYHEIVHSILDTGNYRVYSNDEPLVEWIANCLISLKKQKIL